MRDNATNGGVQEMKAWLIVILSLLPLQGFADIYRIVDKDGYVTFTDTPQKGATKINLPLSQVYSASTHATEHSNKQNNPASRPTAPAPPATKADMDYYRQVQIVSPKNQETIQNSGGKLEVAVGLVPNLRSGDKLVVAIDDEPVTESVDQNASFVLQGIPRGTHRLQAYVMAADTHILKSSEVMTVYMHQASLGQNNKTKAQ